MNTKPDDRLPASPLTSEHSKSARLLIGWVPEEAACAAIAGPTATLPYAPEIVEQVRKAQQTAKQRAPIDRTRTVISEAPKSLATYIEELDTKPFFQAFRAEGWRVCLADLRETQVIQWKIHAAHAVDRTVSAANGDYLSLARITLPLSRAKEITGNGISLDGRMLTVTCRNPMLNIVSMRQPGMPNPVSVILESVIDPTTGLELQRVSFHLLINNSMVQVARWRGAYFLRDGNHRALGLLTRKVSSIPVLYREFSDDENPGLPIGETFSPTVYLGDRPPMLADFLDDAVASSIEVRVSQKTFCFQVIETDVPLL